MPPADNRKNEEKSIKKIKATLHEQWLRSVFHVAGHACAICCVNKARYLPPVYFLVKLNKPLDVRNSGNLIYQKDYRDHLAILEGGLLVNHLPESLIALFDGKATFIENLESKIEEATYVFETDIINLFIGPLTELKYVAFNHGREFKPDLSNIDELEHYGGGAKLLLIKQYIRCITDSVIESEKKLQELFIYSSDFVKNNKNWSAISGLASQFIESGKSKFCYEDITSLLCL